DFPRTNAFVKQAKQEPALATQCRHCRNTTSFACHGRPRRLPAHRPGLAQEGRQRDVRFLLKIQNSPEFPHYSANLRHFGSQPFLTSLFIDFKVLPLWLLIGQASISQPPPDRVLGYFDLTNILDHLLQTSHRPQVGFIAKIGSRKHDNLTQIVLTQIVQQSWPPAAGSPPQPLLPSCIIPSQPTKQCRATNIERVSHLANGKASFDSIHCQHTNFKSR